MTVLKQFSFFLLPLFLIMPIEWAQAQTYCTPTYDMGCIYDDQISNVHLAGESVILDNNSGCSDSGYSDYTDLSQPDLAPGSTYTLSISTDSGGPQLDEARAWIDFDGSGTFEDSEEVANTDGNSMGSGTVTSDFTVPATAASGTYRMRIRLVYEGGNDIDPCANAVYGEAEDYTVEVITVSGCDGNPIAGTVDDNAFAVCSGRDFTLSVTGASEPATGLVRVWQSSPAGEGTWADIAGASASTYTVEGGITTATDYRYKLVCNETDPVYSAIIAVSINPENECYCIPTYDNSCFSGDQINNVTLVGETQSLDNDSECSADNYGDYTLLTPADLLPGNTYTLSITTNIDEFYNENVRAWIDYDQSGTFDDAEVIAATDQNGMSEGTITAEFTVPTTASPGDYRMRVRMAYAIGVPAPIDPCSNEFYGETEDYTLQLLDTQECPKPTALTVDNVTDHSAHVFWTPGGSETTWDVIYGETGFDPETSGQVVQINNDPQTLIDGLAQSASYDVYVRALCNENNQSFLTGPVGFTLYGTPPVNNYLCDALALTPNNGCSEGPYTNLNAFSEPNEPVGSCLNEFHGTNTVWFFFEAPSDGHAVVTTNFDSTDFVTETVVFEAPSDCADMTTLGSEVGCANNGEDVVLDGLEPGDTYYIRIGGFNNAEGNFCIELQTNMGIQDQAFDHFTYYPNPTKERLSLKAGTPIEKVRVYNILGQTVLKTAPNRLQSQLNFADLQTGVYFMSVSLNGTTKTFKIVKE